MNLCARGLGGFLSDWAQSKYGMRGRLWVQMILMAIEGVLCLLVATANTLGGLIAVLIPFSFFLNAAEGATFGIIPYVESGSTGTIVGFVGAGGYAGAIVFILCFSIFGHNTGFMIMGGAALGSSLLSGLINIKGEKGENGTLWLPRSARKKKAGVPMSVGGEDESQSQSQTSSGKRRSQVKVS
jgi:NNP family nitrate/nitrite transporter-like MFS transporter